jgi:cytochrome P450
VAAPEEGTMSTITANTGADQVPDRFDPFELQDTVSGNIRDPYPRMHELRRQSPVHVGPVDLGDGAIPADPDRPPPVTVFGFDEVVQVLRDNETYSSTVYEGVMGAVMGRTILQMDEPDHRVHRALVSPTFRSKVLQRWEEDLVQCVVNELIDGFADKGHVDLVQELTFNFPVQVIARILGLPRSDFPVFQRWAIAITSVAANWERGMAASEALRDYFAGILEERRQQPADDLISELVVAEVDGRQLTDEEIYSFLRLLLPAGVETTYRASGSLLYGLLTNPDQLRAVVADRELMTPAFEEVIRWEPPVTVILRRATTDTVLAGVAIEKGADVALMIGAANRDERKYTEPDRYDMFRSQRQHVGFGFGVHVCLGMHLARMESRIAINTLFDRLGKFTLDPDAEPPHIEGLAFRSPLSLPVVFDAR